jgi:hypothetical protein
MALPNSPLPFRPQKFLRTERRRLERYRLCSHFFGMTTVRRTDEHNLRQAISDILEQTYAIEYAMGLFYRKGTERELSLASEDFEILSGAVERLGTLIADAGPPDEVSSKVAETVG